MLSNAYFIAKFRFDTAENEPAKNCKIFANFANPNPNNQRRTRGATSSSTGGRSPGGPPGPAGGAEEEGSGAWGRVGVCFT